MLDVWRDVFVMGMRALKAGIVWMRLRIVPIQFAFTLPDFIAIPVYYDRKTMIQDYKNRDSVLNLNNYISRLA
jgi:hypothetical protein